MESEIIYQIKNLFSGADERDWQKVERVMADSVLLDYSSLSGSPAQQLTPQQITNGWAAFLPGFDSTRHHLSNFSVTTVKDNTVADFDGKADHFINGDTWTVTGTYNATLEQKEDVWLITALKFNLKEQSGNKDLPALVVQKMQQADKKD